MVLDPRFAYNRGLTRLKLFFAKYSAWIWALLSPLGAWGVFAIAAVDAALLGMPLDAVVGGYVHYHPHRFWLYTLMASAGSALGSLVLYAIGYAGGEALLQKKMSPERFRRIHAQFEQHEFLTLMLPAMLPPPAPFKLFVLSAAAFKVRLRDFLLAIFFGRVVRFAILSFLVLVFGPYAVSVVRALVRENLPLALGALAAAILLGWVVWRQLRRRKDRQRLAVSTEEA